MLNKFFITFDKSQEDIPVLIVGQDDGYYGILGNTPSIKVVNVITGDRAVKMWEELTVKAKENKE